MMSPVSHHQRLSGSKINLQKHQEDNVIYKNYVKI